MRSDSCLVPRQSSLFFFFHFDSYFNFFLFRLQIIDSKIRGLRRWIIEVGVWSVWVGDIGDNMEYRYNICNLFLDKKFYETFYIVEFVYIPWCQYYVKCMVSLGSEGHLRLRGRPRTGVTFNQNPRRVSGVCPTVGRSRLIFKKVVVGVIDSTSLLYLTPHLLFCSQISVQSKDLPVLLVCFCG